MGVIIVVVCEMITHVYNSCQFHGSWFLFSFLFVCLVGLYDIPTSILFHLNFYTGLLLVHHAMYCIIICSKC